MNAAVAERPASPESGQTLDRTTVSSFPPANNSRRLNARHGEEITQQPLYVTHSNNKSSSAVESLVGQVLDNQYEIISLIGQGGMSVVYKARHNMLRKIVAIKTMLPSLMVHPFAMQRFQQEAQAASNIVHTNVITIYNFGITPENQPYLVMDYLEGKSISELLAHHKVLSVSRATNIFLQVANALAHAHKKGVIHRDLKPSNIILIEQGEKKDVVQIVDFGIAKMLTQDGQEALNLTQTGEVFGSPLYMSPEQCKGEKLDHRADIYSLGCLMYETLVGHPPLQGDNTLEVLYKHINEVPRHMSSKSHPIPPKLEAIVFKALAKSPASRYQSMDDLENDLLAFQKLEQFSLLSVFKSKWELSRAKQLPQTRKDKVAVYSIIFALIVSAGAALYPVLSVWNLANGPIAQMPLLFNDDRRTTRTQLEEVNNQVFGIAVNQAKLFLANKASVEDNMTLYASLMRHGRLYADQGFFDAAARAYDYAISVSKKINGASAYPTIRARLEAGNVAYNQGRWDDAEKGILSYLPVLTDQFKHAKEIAYYQARLGNCYWNTQDYAEARKYYETAMRTWNLKSEELPPDLGGDDKFSIALATSRLAGIYQNLAKHEATPVGESKDSLNAKSVALLKIALPLWREVQNGNAKNEGICEVQLGTALERVHEPLKSIRLKQPDGKVKDVQTNVAIHDLILAGTDSIKAACGPESLDYALALLSQADYEWKTNNFDAAIRDRWVACSIFAHISEHPLR
jgi:serine/threonine protein kinase